MWMIRARLNGTDQRYMANIYLGRRDLVYGQMSAVKLRDRDEAVAYLKKQYEDVESTHYRKYYLTSYQWEAVPSNIDEIEAVMNS